MYADGSSSTSSRTTISAEPCLFSNKESKPRLLSLAPELIQIIADELDIRHVRSLRLVCRYLSRALVPIAFRNLTISVSKNTLGSDLAKLRTLASPGCPASFATRRLTIGALSPCFDPTYTGPTWKFVDDEWVAEEQPQDHEGLAKALEEIRTLIVPAISSLKGLHSVIWKPIEKDDNTTQALVMNAIGRALNLRSLRLTLSYCKVPISFDNFSHLRGISIEGTSQKYHEETFESLARMIARSPDLTSIDIVSNWRYYYGIDRTQSLHQLFKYCAPDAPPLRLRHLGLQMCLVKLDATTLPHLRHLRSLRLTYIEDPHTRARYTIEEEESGDSALRREQKRYGSSLAEFWTTLLQTGIQLEDITLDVVVPPFVDYLASYSGVRRLHLTPGGFQDGSTSDLIGEAFYTRALPKHAAFLEDLNVNAVYDGGWCFGSHNREILARCTRLRTWRISIVETQESNNVSDLLDTVCLFMPQLEAIDICSTTAEELRSAYCGSPILAHLMRTTRAITQNIEMYKPPTTVPPNAHLRLPKVTVSSDKVFAAQGSRFVDCSPAKDMSEHDYWRYQSYVSFC
ncbi:hypothetical protein D9619_008755 [Psilocybe cf. subviscida]|uniref:F-box domain-containing protein n=1 Tax=Psilocybe cf. subviscida TaxID=2480587 RepID=A0A8H5F0L9_9AGAR|nr:hypothetical protein D9619_008755 [Psilocybe cf. subviscida]